MIRGMEIWGVDLGVRSFAAFGITPAGYQVHTEVLPYLSPTKQHAAQRYEELRHLTQTLGRLLASATRVYVEEPPLAGRKNIRTALVLSQTAGALVSACSCPAYLVPVSTWKQVTVGNGDAEKASVADWLHRTHPDAAELCGADQNLMDAAAIAFFGSSARAHFPGQRRVGASRRVAKP